MARHKTTLPNSTSIELGSRLKAARKKHKLTQTELGERLGISFQQIQKYESGKNELSTHWQNHICKSLGLDEDFFFRGFALNRSLDNFRYDSESPSVNSTMNDSAPEKNQEAFILPALDQLTVDLLKVFSRIQDEEARRNVLNLARSIVKLQDS